MRLREQRKSNLAAAFQGITPLKCVPICDKSHHPWKSCSCSSIREGENLIRPLRRPGKYQQRKQERVIPANSEPCSHLRALTGLFPDIMGARSGFRSSSSLQSTGGCVPTVMLQETQRRNRTMATSPSLPPSLLLCHPQDLEKGHKQA